MGRMIRPAQIWPGHCRRLFFVRLRKYRLPGSRICGRLERRSAIQPLP
jgi:hypothetical protein